MAAHSAIAKTHAVTPHQSKIKGRLHTEAQTIFLCEQVLSYCLNFEIATKHAFWRGVSYSQLIDRFSLNGATGAWCRDISMQHWAPHPVNASFPLRVCVQPPGYG